MKKLTLLTLLAGMVGWLTGCVATRTISDAAFGAGGAALGGAIGKNHPAAIAGGAAGGILLSEGLHYAAKSQAGKAYASGYDQGRSDAVKQQYWLQQNQQATRRNARVRHDPEHKLAALTDAVLAGSVSAADAARDLLDGFGATSAVRRVD